MTLEYFSKFMNVFENTHSDKLADSIIFCYLTPDTNQATSEITS